MALDLTPDQKVVGQGNFHRVVGKLGVNRREFMQGMLAAGTALPLTAAAYFGYNNTSFGDRPVKAGLIGAGDEGGVLVGEHNPRYLQFIAYSDIRPSNQQRIFQGEPTGPRRGFNFHYGTSARNDIRLYEDYKELLANKDIEAVVIALPLNLHAKVTIDALRAGKHVLCEKLMAWDVGQCKEMIKVADEQNKILSIGHQRHYSMLYAHANEILKSEALGDIRHIRALWHRNSATPAPAGGTEMVNNRTILLYTDSWRKPVPPVDANYLRDSITRYGWKDVNELVRWRLYRKTGGGLMAELGSHQLDACSIFLGKKKPLAVSASGGKYFYQDDREIEDHVYCTFEFPGKNYDRNAPLRDEVGNALHNDIVTVSYSSINTNDFEKYGECVMGSRGTLIVEEEQNAYLYGRGARNTSVSVGGGGGSVITTSSTTPDAGERRAQDIGQASLGHAPPSRGYREEMEHLAYIIRNRDQGMESDQANLRPRCDGRAALGDAVMALVANIAMRDQTRIVFREEWFDASKPDTPEGDHPYRRA